jgi:putative salt-induced outer membrane protein YdiY
MRPGIVTIITTVSVVLITTATSFGQAVATVTNTPWDISAAAGLTLTRGNSKTLLFTGNILGEKKWEQKNELSLGVDGVYGENSGVKNAESLHGFGQYNRLFTERLFGYLRVEGLHDAIADIKYRLTVSPGLGYYFIKQADTTFRGEVGPGYLYEKDSDGSHHSYMTLRLAERFEHKLNDHAKVWEAAEILPQVDKFDNYIINAEVGVETAMTKKLSLQTYLQDTYHSQPAAGRLKNDLKLVAGVKYKF